MPVLFDVMPHEFKRDSSYPAHKYGNIAVIAQHYSHTVPWPGKHKNVMFWCVLDNGKAVGWNESPSYGWSFPVIKYSEE